jgi:hypothetical protein
LEVYNINNNQLTGAAFIGTVGLDWQFAGVAPVHAAGASDLVLRNVNTGAFEVYDIANNQITGAAPLGAVGLDWQLGGFAANPPTGSMGSSDGSTSQLVQAMAGFGGSGAGESLNTAPLGAETSQQPLLATPQHARGWAFTHKIERIAHGRRLLRCGSSIWPMTANGMVRPCSGPASKRSWQGAPKTRSTPCHTSSILESP